MKKKRYIQAMCLLGIIYCILSTTLYAKTRSTKEKPGAAIFVMATKDSLLTCTKSYKYNSEVISLDMKVPQISGLKNHHFQKQLNHKLLTEAKARKKIAISEAEQYNKEMIKDRLPPLKFEYMESFAVIPSPPRYFTLELFKYQYSGGAHGISQLNYITVDLENNKIIQLKDLFKPNVNYTSIINKAINAQLIKRQAEGEVFFIGPGGFNGIKEDQNFYIDSNGNIIIVFNVYEIAPYAAGVVEVPLSKTDLSPYMK